MIPDTIDRRQAIDLFHDLMQPYPRFQVLRILGEPKMGKTHLISSLYPSVTEDQYHTPYALLDLSDQTRAPLELLQVACEYLGGRPRFPHYCEAYQETHAGPRIQLSNTDLRWAVLRILQRTGQDDSERRRRFLTTQFVADVEVMCGTPVLFLFDQIDGDSGTVSWLMNDLLARLTRFPHVRIVVGGRAVPEPCKTYDRLCRSHELRPVRDIQAYRCYSRQRRLRMTEESIPDLVHISDYKPGLFVDIVASRFLP